MTQAGRLAAAISLLAAIDAAPRKPADAVANAFFRERRYIGSGDRRSVSDRAWGVIRARRRLGWWLARCGGRQTPRLLVAAHLMLTGWSADGVAQSFSGGAFAPERLDRDEKPVVAALAGQTLDHPEMPTGVRIEAPEWIVPLLEARFGAGLDAEMAAMELPAPVDLRVNLLKGDRAAAQAALAAEGVAVEETALSPWGLRVPARLPVVGLKPFQEGLVEIQDEGSQLVAALVGAAPEMRVVDWCAGAGGKTLALAMTMQNRGHIVAADVSAPRLEGAVKRLRRAGVHNVERHLQEAGDKWVKRREGSFDRVLVDAPCTGTGTWRRNPDARQRLRPHDLAELQVKQAAILDLAARLVRKGGRLVYATCSLLTEENEAQVTRFLADHPDFAVVPLAAAWTLPSPLPCDGDYLVLTPRRHGTDGFFAAVLERTK
jgi:16S rRNA (cytosine967-C5)-methyltransferase